MAPLQFLEVFNWDVADTNVPVGGQVMSVAISLAATAVLTLFLRRPVSYLFLLEAVD